MNALSRSATSLVPRAARFAVNRPFATATKPGESPGFKQAWLQTSGTYPIIVILGFACSFCAFVGTTCLFKNPDVRMDRSKRGTVIRTWGN
mmetsp:Transcript_1203/g.1827  ORF Transcript_1203/g.1827 Transcript_1203/m.1827 type:complete len:91 (-) Transcript_1203:350-622(-)